MANELEIIHNAFPITLQLVISNVGAGATPVDGSLAGAVAAKTGWVVPAGYIFHPMYIDVLSNDARTAGSNTIKVTGDGTEIGAGPDATLDATNTTADRGVATLGASPMAAGVIVGVSSTGDGSFAPTTADADVILSGVLTPVV